ncbi:AzlC family ABC transporter permease [Streptomyces sp. HSW2009]|uniref:AzlC family ABC transporter permease n=1 Tax=Streptomyces sp. HSW2009 TaxID=3142890 RepID=UPI0032EB9E91
MWRTLDRSLLRGIVLACLAVGAIGVSYGAVCVTEGFPMWFPVLAAFLVLAASSEFLFVGVISAGGSPVAAVLVALLANARHLPYGLAIPPRVIQPGWRRVVASHLMNDESVVLALAQPDVPRQRSAYWVCGVGMLICWPAGALLGALAGNVIHDTDALGLDAMFPAVILALMLPALRERKMRRAALAGAAVALAATPFLPSGLPVLLALGAVFLNATPAEQEKTP